MKTLIVLALVAVCVSSVWAAGPAPAAPANPYAAYANWPWKDANFFPIAVWLQDPKNADAYKAAGVNLFVGIFDGPKAEDLAAFEKAGMHVICDQNEVALKYAKEKPNGVIVGWMHGDEPDNAQDIKNWKSIEDIKAAWPESTQKTLKDWGTYGPPIPPKTIIADYDRLKKNDPTRPIMLNLGQGVAFDKYNGRGYRSGKLDDYPEYIKGCDIASFDIYPVAHDNKEVKGNLWFVGQGVDRLAKWGGWGDHKKIVWNCIECTQGGKPPAIASPSQIKTEVWMSLIRGSGGLIYFCHEFEPKFIEAGLLAHPEQLKAVSEVNHQILSLAPVLNSQMPTRGFMATSSDSEVPVAVMVRSLGGATYLFAVSMRDKETTITFSVSDVADTQAMDIYSAPPRPIQVKRGIFQDKFKGYEVHIYKIQ